MKMSDMIAGTKVPSPDPEPRIYTEGEVRRRVARIEAELLAGHLAELRSIQSQLDELEAFVSLLVLRSGGNK